MARDLYAWMPVLEELAQAAGQPKTPSGNGANSNGSTVEAAADLKGRIETLQGSLEALAAEAYRAQAGDDAKQPTAPPALVLYSLAEWVTRQPIADGITRELDAIHHEASRLVGYAPDKAEAACPCCRLDLGAKAPRLQREPNKHGLPDLYTCPRCGYTGIIEKSGPWNGNRPMNTLAVTMRLRVQDALEKSDEWAKPGAAGKLAGVSASTVRTWKQRGLIEANEQGEVSVAQVARLARERNIN